MAKNQTDPKENEYESLTLVYYKEANAMVPLVIVGIGTAPIMQGSWNDDDNKMLEVVVEPCTIVDKEPTMNVEGSP